MDVLTLARRNMLATLRDRAHAYAVAGNVEMADLYTAAVYARWSLIESGVVQVGEIEVER